MFVNYSLMNEPNLCFVNEIVSNGLFLLEISNKKSTEVEPLPVAERKTLDLDRRDGSFV